MLTIDVLPLFLSRSHRDLGATSESHHSMTGLLFQKAYNLQCLLQVRAFSRYIWLVIQNAKRYASQFGSCSALKPPWTERSPLFRFVKTLSLGHVRDRLPITPNSIVSFTMPPNDYPLISPRIQTLSSDNEP
jgi:hypothetical protein